MYHRGSPAPPRGIHDGETVLDKQGGFPVQTPDATRRGLFEIATAAPAFLGDLVPGIPHYGIP